MTREEAKAVMQSYKDNPLVNNKEAFEIAIKALEQEPCEDCISREQAKTAIRDRFKDLPSRVEINTVLNELPSVATSYNSIKTELKSCEDCISRQTVLDKIKEICFSREQEWVNFRVSQGSHGQRDLIINFIEDLPSVQPKPQPKTGHWISCGDVYMCSECDSVGVDYDNYCSNCGARMERSE